MARFAVRRLEEIPRIPPSEPGDFDWFPLQHYFRLTAFGVNVYVATEDGGEVITTHSESDKRQEELYLVVAGEATFTLDAEEFDAPAVTVVAVPEWSVVRSATAKTAGTTVIAIGDQRKERFETSWQPKWFDGVPQIDE